MNYRDESVAFIDSAFQLLDALKNDPLSCKPEKIVKLKEPYYLKINHVGDLSLLEILTDESGDKVRSTIKRFYNRECSSIDYIGMLLPIYIRLLQEAEHYAYEKQ